MTRHYWARLVSGGIWGWDVEILSCDADRPAFVMSELPVRHAWTERGARRKAARMIRRRAAANEQRIIIVGTPPQGPGTVS